LDYDSPFCDSIPQTTAYTGLYWAQALAVFLYQIC
jgi:hypothetical protein